MTAARRADFLRPVAHASSPERRIAESLRRKALQLGIKRCFDVLAAGLGLLLLGPLLALVSLAVWLTSKGPILFLQARIGYLQQEFTIYKFRSMQVPGECEWDVLARQAADSGKLLKAADDPRLTAVGRVLRRWSLDELPQLINVLKGDMSLVGPRPLLPFMLEPHPNFAAVRSLLRPGLTGLWQVSGRQDNTSAAGMLPYDVRYVREFSLWLDLQILIRTLPAVVSQKGAW